MGSRKLGFQCIIVHMGSVVVAPRLRCSKAHGSFRDGTCVPCIGRQTLNQWTTREVSIMSKFWIDWGTRLCSELQFPVCWIWDCGRFQVSLQMVIWWVVLVTAQSFVRRDPSSTSPGTWLILWHRDLRVEEEGVCREWGREELTDPPPGC